MARKKKVVEEVKEEIIIEEKVIDIPEYYMLKVGETLEDVSKKFNVSIDKLKELNGNVEVFGGNQIKLK